jgi:flagellar biosynthesis component FlhA
MKLTNVASGFCAIIAVASAVSAPMAAGAQGSLSDESHHRQQKKNEWRNLAIGSGALGVLGLVKGNSTLALAGLGGGLYSLNRYEQDRKSQSKIDRRRAELYSRHEYRRNGHRYVRRTVSKNGHKYYKFVRAD